MSEHGDTRPIWNIWTQMSENMVEDKSYNQPLKLWEEIHTGNVMIEQAHGQVLPKKQHPACNLAVKIVEQRELQRAAENPGGKSQMRTLHRPLNGMDELHAGTTEK